MRKVNQTKVSNPSNTPRKPFILKKVTTVFSALVLSATILAACTSTTTSATSALGSANQTTISTATVTTPVKTTSADLVTFKDKDLSTEWSTDSSTAIKLSSTSATVTGSGAKASGSTVTISSAGTYVISGKLTDGQIVVNSIGEGDVHIVLNGVSITNKDSAPIYIQEADNVILTLQDGTENTLTDGASYVFADSSTDEPSAALFSKADLTINGTGTLQIDANYKDGITSKDDLKIVSGTFQIDAADDGIVGKDMVAIQKGTFTIKAGGDGIKSTNDEAADKGFVAISDGTFNITANNDGIQAETVLVTDNGSYTITTGGGSAEAESHTEEMPQGGMGGGGTPPAIPGAEGSMSNQGNEAANPSSTTTSGNTDVSTTSATTGSATTRAQTASTTTATSSSSRITSKANSATGTATTTNDADASTSSDSAKALKAGTDLVINGGTFTIDAKDDSVHSNGSVTINGGTLKLTTGDDGIHAETALSVTAGTVDILNSYEGLEGATINVMGGDIHVVASDDGVNATEGTTTESTTGTTNEQTASTTGDAATGSQPPTPPSGGMGGGRPESSGNAMLNISGGTLYVDAGGDGLDANGSITMSGGTVIVNGPTNNGNGALDYDGTFEMTGGYLVAAGSSGMAQSTSDSSSQYAIAMSYSATQAAGTLVHLQDSAGNDVLTFAPEKDYQSIVISSPELKAGSYVLYSGGQSTGTATNGLYTDGEYSGGTKVVSFDVANKVTWLTESGVSESNPNGAFGPSGGGRGMNRPGGTSGAGNATTDGQSTDSTGSAGN